MTTALDLDAYFERIRWCGGTNPTLDTLAGLLAAHTARIPFENLDVLLGRPIRLDLNSIQSKLVRASRGGYCFEHATLFAAVLEALGFQPTRHAARVVLFAPSINLRAPTCSLPFPSRTQGSWSIPVSACLRPAFRYLWWRTNLPAASRRPTG